MLSAAWYFSPGAQRSSRATSSVLSTTGRRSGEGVAARHAPKPARPSVIWKKNRRADTAAFIVAGLAPPAAMCRWKRRRSSGSASSGDRPRKAAKALTYRM